ncbi:MAG: hypothetical protein ACREJ5_05745 [Geminicoccaceae bacterium]
MNKMLIALPLILAAPAMAQDVTFDIEAYCARVADAVGGSYQIEETCRQQEVDAREAMGSTEQRIATYCARVADAVGGSYQIYNACVDQEEAARGRIGQ